MASRRPGTPPPCRLRLRPRRDEGDAHRGGDRCDRARVRGRLRSPPRRTASATRRRSRRTSSRVSAARRSPPGRSSSPASCNGTSRRHDARSVRAEPRAAGGDRAARRRLHARRACRRAPVADARGAQWRKVTSTPRRTRSARSPVSRTAGSASAADLRRPVSGLVDEGKAVAAAQGIELDADPEEPIDHAAARMWPTSTRRACSRTSRRGDGPRSTT